MGFSFQRADSRLSSYDYPIDSGDIGQGGLIGFSGVVLVVGVRKRTVKRLRYRLPEGLLSANSGL
jgi:hypothetical protein